MATESGTAAKVAAGGGLIGQIEVHSIDWIPDADRHGKVWQQTMLWLLGNFQYFTIPIGFVGPGLGLSLGWSILAGALGIAFGTLPSIGGFAYTGYVPGHLTNGVDYSWLVGLVVSGLAYWLLSRSLDVTGEQAAVEASERELRAIDLVAKAGSA